MSQDLLAEKLPFTLPQPDDPKRRRAVRIARLAAVALLAAALLIPVFQLQHKILRNQRRLETYRQKKITGTLTPAAKDKGRPKGHKGALNRWRPHIRAFWRGENIYVTPEQYVAGNSDRPPEQRRKDNGIRHPNSIFMVMLLTPFAYLPTSAAGLVFSLLKVMVYLASAWAAVRVCNDGRRRMPDWIVGLGLAWWIVFAISDIQHVNTNGFVLGAIVLHLWLYRRGNDLWAGAALAAAVAMKLTPALFILYWLYQRNWRLLGGCVLAGLLLAVILPAAILGTEHYITLTRTWLDNLIFQGLGGAWYPIHVNQSLPAILGRYLLGGRPGGDLHWNPDDFPYEAVETMGGHAWIAVASLPETTVRGIIKIVQIGIVLLMGLAIGWRKRPRDDGRRGLHYAMVLAGMMLLNQRTWDHHAAVLLPAMIAAWYAIAYGHMSRAVRAVTLTMILWAGILLWVSAGDATVALCRMTGMAKQQAKNASDVVQAYGLKGCSFLLVFLTAAILSLAMRRREPAYDDQRRPLRTPKPPDKTNLQ
ncbi:MAG: DUF2029 domain-containing protein [Phycisphaerae bacterium]|nr:DUF2029 domain-containing protein [Phycisphaerae bacterium]